MSEPEFISSKVKGFLGETAEWTRNTLNIGSEFEECFQKIIPPGSKRVTLIEKQVVSYIAENLEDDLRLVIQRGGLDEKLKSLEELEEKYSNNKGKNAWRPPGDPKLHMKNARILAKEDELHQLSTILEVREISINKKKNELKKMMDALAASKSKLDEGLATYQPFSKLLDSTNELVRAQQLNEDIVTKYSLDQ